MLADRVVEMRRTLRDGGQARAAAPRVAILIPCYNEELTVAEVIHQFRNQMPAADIYVFDNNSSDRTVERARSAGATNRPGAASRQRVCGPVDVPAS